MSETRSHKLGKKMADIILEVGNLMYNNRTKANFFRGVIRGLLEHEWVRDIIRNEKQE